MNCHLKKPQGGIKQIEDIKQWVQLISIFITICKRQLNSLWETGDICRLSVAYASARTVVVDYCKRFMLKSIWCKWHDFTFVRRLISYSDYGSNSYMPQQICVPWNLVHILSSLEAFHPTRCCPQFAISAQSHRMNTATISQLDRFIVLSRTEIQTFWQPTAAFIRE